MKVAGIFICLLMLLCGVDAKSQNNLPEQRQDSLSVLRDDSTVVLTANDSIPALPNNKSIAEKKDTVEIKVVDPLTVIASDKFFAPSYMFSPSPRKAVLYSALFPGLGQIYNRKYWKLPILYGGFVGLTYAITWNNGYYRDYLGAYQDIMDDNPNTNRWHNMLPYGMDPESIDTQWFTDVLKQRKDRYRYYRDLSIIITFGVYLLGIVDAYVDAQLFDFDMSPDLSMRVAPAVIMDQRSNNIGNSSFGLQWSLNF